MRIGLNGGGHARDLGALRAQARGAARDGFASYWLSQALGPDALTALAVIGAETPAIELGVSIVPLYGRHPVPLAIQAVTTQAACGGRLVLGVGVSHPVVVEGMLGLSYARSFSYARESVLALKPLLRGERVSFAGKELTARAELAIDHAPPPPLLLAALGPRMLELAGREADGVTTWMVGAKTLAQYIVPAVRRAAEQAGRPRPRAVVGLPACVTDDVTRARAYAREKLAVYASLPAYRATLEREGASGPEDLLLAGDEDAVADRIAAVADAGATDLRVLELCPTPEDAARTRALLARLARGRAAA